MASIQRHKAGGQTKYRAVIRRKGFPHRSKTFLTKRAAEQWARRVETEAEQDLAAGRQDQAGALRMKFSALADQYMTRGWKGKDASRGYQVAFWAGHLGDLQLHEITTPKVQAALDAYRDGRCRVYAGIDTRCRQTTRAGEKRRSGASVNRMRSALAAVVKYANQEYHLELRFVANTRREAEPKGRQRFLSDEELGRLLEACRASRWERLHLLVLMAITTGARLGELTGLRWSDIDFDARTASVERTKNGEPRVMPLPLPAIQELKKFREVGAGWVFPSPLNPGKRISTGVRAFWEAAVEQAGLNADPDQERFVFHSLRHSCASFLAASGASLLEIGSVLGHKSLQSTARYSHLCVKSKQQLTDAVFGEKLGGGK